MPKKPYDPVARKAYMSLAERRAVLLQYLNQPRVKALRKRYAHTGYLRHKAKRDIDNKKRRARLQALVDELKVGPCTDCGNHFPPCAMDFDHVEGTKFRKISDLTARCVGIATLASELDKCELVCANCHRIRHDQRGYRVRDVA